MNNKDIYIAGNHEMASQKYVLWSSRLSYCFAQYMQILKKIAIKSLFNLIGSKIITGLKKVARKLKLKYIFLLISGYFKNRKKYKTYDENTIFMYGIPEYGNMGDQAISIAETKYVSGIFPDKKIVLIPECETEKSIICLKLITNKYHNLCVLPGGGNLGNLYPRQEKIRLSAIKILKKAKIIVFPQSIDYLEMSEPVKKAKKIYEAHKNLVVFTREKNSQALREKIFPNCEGYLVPDIVLSYKPNIPDYDRNGILFCTRNDKEKNQNSITILKSLEQAFEEEGNVIEYIDTYNKENARKYEYQLEGLNTLWSKFKKSELVITDRLHGMIFCVVTGTPCIAVDNSTGKVGYLYNTWLKDSNVVYISHENEIDNAIEMIKSKKYKKINFDFDEFNTNYLQLAKLLKKFGK